MSAKYPRSSHLPWSPGGTRDDKRLLNVASLLNQEIVITEKLDGSNLAFTKHYVFARSHSAVAQEFTEARGEVCSAGHVTSSEHWMFQEIRVQQMTLWGFI